MQSIYKYAKKYIFFLLPSLSIKSYLYLRVNLTLHLSLPEYLHKICHKMKFLSSHGYQPISMQEQTTPKSQGLKVSYPHCIYIVYPFILGPSLKDQPNLGYSFG